MSALGYWHDEGHEAAFAEAERYWQGWEEQSPGNKERAAHGRAQAERMKPLFMARLYAWQGGVLPESRWRLVCDAVECA